MSHTKYPALRTPCKVSTKLDLNGRSSSPEDQRQPTRNLDLYELGRMLSTVTSSGSEKQRQEQARLSKVDQRARKTLPPSRLGFTVPWSSGLMRWG